MIFSGLTQKTVRVEKRGGKGPGPSLGLCLVWRLKTCGQENEWCW